ncbi:MAG: hypothetical protein BZ136_07365 [Methanosphaera sp. rholeuAM74]|nr:MAG: hypothetical protein BZ136_07365 [Methanosphaera sp. rholeuAM74]
MEKCKTYSFRDNKGLLEGFDKGTRSEFIREAIETKIRMKEIYDKELIEVVELIDYYSDRLEWIEYEIKRINKDKKKLLSMKRKTKNKHEKFIIERNKMLNALEREDNLDYEDNLDILKDNACKTIITNLLLQLNDPSVKPVDTKYLKNKAKFISMDELRQRCLSYVEKHVPENTVISNMIVTKKDIKYLKKMIKFL